MARPENNLSVVKKVALILVFAAVLFFIIYYGAGYLKQRNIEIEKESLPAESVKLSIQNGCEIQGIAKSVKNILLEQNHEKIDIISWKNVDSYKFIYDKTVIVVKKDDSVKLNYIKKITGIQRTIISLNFNSLEDYQIILGKDYKQYFR
jgi:hypothetical protein